MVNWSIVDSPTFRSRQDTHPTGGESFNMAMRIATAEWANPDEVEERYLYRDGMIWLGRSASENQVSLGYEDDRHVCLVAGSRGGKGTSSILPVLLGWPGSICLLDPKGENATVSAARRGQGSQYS